jgi:hypothetical protein
MVNLTAIAELDRWIDGGMLVRLRDRAQNSVAGGARSREGIEEIINGFP